MSDLIGSQQVLQVFGLELEGELVGVGGGGVHLDPVAAIAGELHELVGAVGALLLPEPDAVRCEAERARGVDVAVDRAGVLSLEVVGEASATSSR